MPVSNEILTAAVVLFGGGGIISGVVAFFKLRPDLVNTTVDAAEGAVVIQTSIISALREEVQRLRDDCTRLREEQAEERQRCNEELRAMRRMLVAIDERQESRRVERERRGLPNETE